MTRAHRAGLLIAIGLLLAGGTPIAYADQLNQDYQRQDQLNGNIDSTNNAIRATKAQEAQVQTQLDALNAQIAVIEAELARETAKLDQILGQINQANSDLDAKRADEAARRALWNKRSRSLYKDGGSASLLVSLLSASSFSQLVDRLLVMRDIVHSDDVLLDQIKRDKQAISDLLAQLDQLRAAQKSVVDQIAGQEGDLQGKYAQQAALEGQLKSKQRSLEAQRAEAERSLAEVNAEVAQLEAARRYAHSSGIFAWPGVQGPITQGFGCTDYAAEPRNSSCPASKPYFHSGIDIAGPYGSAITATDGGIAYTYLSSYGYGNHIIIVHANGFTSLYGHMSSFVVSNGQAVLKGQRIGYEGSTGNSSGPHLHFEIRLNDNPQDPCRYVGC